MSAGRTTLLLFIPVALAAFLVSFYKVTTYDIFWHLKTGEVILGQGALVRTNLFSSTWPDYPWVNPEWIFQIAAAALYGALGWTGITIAKIATVFLLAAALYSLMILRGGKPLPATALTVISLSAMQFRLTERPHLFSYLLLTLVLLVAQRHRLCRDRVVWVLPALFALWSNIHPQVVVGLLCLGAVAAGDRLGRGRWDRSLVTAAVLSLPAALLNPDGLHVITFPFVHAFLGPVVEMTEYARTTLPAVPVFWAFLALTAAVLLFRRRSVEAADFVMVAGAALVGILYLRETPFLFIVAAPVVCALLSEEELWERAGFRKWVRTGSVILAAAALTWALGFDRLLPYRWGWGLDESDFPAAAADLLEKGVFPERLYNGYGWGGYLAFRLHPKVGIFQDGRTIAYPREYLTRLNAGFSFGDWPALLKEYDVNTALALRSEAERRFPSGEWGTVFWDDRWVLLVRRSPGNEDLLGEYEYRRFLPGAPLSFTDGQSLELLAGEMERNQRERRGRSAVTDNNLGVLYRRLGEEDRAEEALRKAVAADGSYAPAWANLGALYLARGERGMAVDALERAVLADPGLASAAALLERLRSAKEPL